MHAQPQKNLAGNHQELNQGHGRRHIATRGDNRAGARGVNVAIQEVGEVTPPHTILGGELLLIPDSIEATATEVEQAFMNGSISG